MNKRIIGLLGMVILASTSILFGQRIGERYSSSHLEKKTMRIGNFERTYYVYLPKRSKKMKFPVVFVFHGGGGKPLQMDRKLGFTELAQKEKFIVVYPAGVGGNWNDGRKTNASLAHRERVDDIKFVVKMISSLGQDYLIDDKRIYATGISNGGIFSHYVGANLSEKIAAIAPVAGGIADPFNKRFNPNSPISVFIIQGTKDRLVPYDGKSGIGLRRRRNRGKIISTDNAIALWTKHNQTNQNPTKGRLPNIDRRDGCTVETYEWSNGNAGTSVKLFKQVGGGHTWPGGSQFLPKFLVGNVCRDFSATTEIWEFFKQHRKP